MIKAAVKVACRINGNASVRSAKDGSQFISIPCLVTIRDRSGQSIEQPLNISCDPALAMPQFIMPGSRIEVEGDLYFRRRSDNLYLNMRASSVNINPQSLVDAIEGTLVIQGKSGEKIIEKADKKGQPMTHFSAYTSEKVEDSFEYIWVSITAFKTSRPAWLQPKARVEASGTMELGVYNGNLTISCACRELKQPTQQ